MITVESKERVNEGCYDECLYVSAYCKDFQKNPRKKPKRLSQSVKSLLILSLIMTAAMAVLFVIFRTSKVFIALTAVFAVLSVLLIAWYTGVRYRQEIEDALKTYNRESLLVDNT